MTTPPNDQNKLRGFFDAAKRQQDIEEHVREHGESQRAQLELDAATQLSPAAREQRQKEIEQQERAKRQLTRIENEIGVIITALSSLPADNNGQRFEVARERGGMGGVIINCHYTNDSRATRFLIKNSESPAFRIYIAIDDCIERDVPFMTIDDYNRRNVTHTSFKALENRPTDWDDLRGMIGSCVARMAPHRLDEIADALQLQSAAPESSTGLSKSIILKAPALPFRSPIQKKNIPAAAQPKPPAKKPWLGRWFKP